MSGIRRLSISVQSCDRYRISGLRYRSRGDVARGILSTTPNKPGPERSIGSAEASSTRLASLSTVLYPDRSQLSLASADAIGGYAREEIASRRLEIRLSHVHKYARASTFRAE
jgi:hypothetical protein